MARLRRDALGNNDPAESQLLGEAAIGRESPTHQDPNTTSAAVQAANLLNNARNIPTHLHASSQHGDTLRTKTLQNIEGVGAVAKKAGKLKRPSFYAENLAQVSRTRDPHMPRKPIFDLPSSPEKTMTNKVNHKPLKRVKKRKGAQTEDAEDPPIQGSKQAMGNVPYLAPTSNELEPLFSPNLLRTIVANETEKHLTGGKVRCTGKIKTLNTSHPVGSQCAQPGTIKTAKGWRCRYHVSDANNALDSSQPHLRSDEGKLVAKAAEGDHRRNTRQSGGEVDLSNKDWGELPEKAAAPRFSPRKKRRVREPQRLGDHDNDAQEVRAKGGAKRRLRMESSEQQPPKAVIEQSERQTTILRRSAAKDRERRTGTRRSTRHSEAAEIDNATFDGEALQANGQSAPDEDDGLFIPEDGPPATGPQQLSNAVATSKSLRHREISAKRIAAKRSQDRIRHQPGQRQAAVENDSDADENARDTDQVSDENPAVQDAQSEVGIEQEDLINQDDLVAGYKSSYINTIVEYINDSCRARDCKLREASTIRQACQEAYDAFQVRSLEAKDVIEMLREIYVKLHKGAELNVHGSQKIFKSDAYAYLFRSLALVFKAVYDWAKENLQEPPFGANSELSFEALQFLTPLTHEILAFSTNIERWKAKIDSRFQGDAIVARTRNGFFSPLREIYKLYKADLRTLDHAQQLQGIRQRATQVAQEEAAEDERRERLRQQHLQRRERWHYLHTCRLKCEPDARRRRQYLFYKPIPDLQERDANGDEFERIELFAERDTPPMHRSPPEMDTSWRTEQNEALLDGLQQYAGPHVFEQIFKQYCHRDGILRDFNVTQITAQAAYFARSLQELDAYKSQKWLTKIPILP